MEQGNEIFSNASFIGNHPPPTAALLRELWENMGKEGLLEVRLLLQENNPRLDFQLVP